MDSLSIEVVLFFRSGTSRRDRAMFMLMLRCGLRVEEVANLSLNAIDYRQGRLFVYNGKGSKDRVVYMSNDASAAFAEYLRLRRPTTRVK